MMLSSLFAASLFAASAYCQSILYTDKPTGISFQGYTDATGFRLGLALPQDAKADFIGQFVRLLKA